MIKENKTQKSFSSENYNFYFNKDTGFFVRWGKNKNDDPVFSEFGPEIADIEVSTVCNQGCQECYKSNTGNGENMSLETFTKLFSKLPQTVCQIAFGIGDIDGNPDLFKIFEYCREQGVVPNVTINGSRMTPYYYDELARLCGAVAVSNYGEQCYDAVKELTDRGMKQVNIHQILSIEALSQCHQLITDKKTDPRLAKLNAIVFLSLKPKGERNCSHIITDRQLYVDLIKKAVEEKIAFGFDSCFAPIFQDVAKDVFPAEVLEEVMTLCEPCESFGLFSSYIDVKGHFYPCSFCSGTKNWETGINVLEVEDFLKDVWNSPRLSEGRTASLECNRRCLPYPELYACLKEC
jgi:MoaA/NifB/PqqE/SkfB family radical SAM enzyme